MAASVGVVVQKRELYENIGTSPQDISQEINTCLQIGLPKGQ